MATGEYTSVRTEGEATEARVAEVVARLEGDPETNQAMLSSIYERRGVRPEVADAVAEDLSANPDEAIRSHACELLGVDPSNLDSPWVAAVSSFFSFALGAMIPLLPYLLGWTSLAASLGLSAIALFGVGALVSRLTSRPMLYSGARQLALGALSATATYLIGSLIGASI
jgi:VIT1/CCC1 family predicted Fe2+/Mn2+ transporter